MKKYLISDKGRFFKANLHCHSTVSDGRLSPEEIKKAYMEKGYSIVAYTDHDVLIPHPELAEENFLPLNGFEVEINEPGKSDFCDTKTCHICYIALEPDNLIMPFYHRTEYLFGNSVNYRHLVKFDESKPDYIREYNGECISDMIKQGRDNGFFVTYNHPRWSMENYDQYMSYNGMNAMEICNYGCWINGYGDYNEREYDDMLTGGKKIFCIATDDNHNVHPLDSKNSDSFGGFTMIKAEKLEYSTITDALLRGDFYASQGPEIYDLWVEDGNVHITCSDCESIIMTTGRRNRKVVYNVGKGLTEAVFPYVDKDIYFRITVTDKCGLHANTNAYFVDELR